MTPFTTFLKNLTIIAVLFAIIVPLCLTFETHLPPPTGIFFEAAQMSDGEFWALLSSATRFGVALSLFSIAYAKLVAIGDHHSAALQRRAKTISLMFMITGAWTSTIAMMIEFGGVWHLVSMVFGLIEFAMSIYTVRMVLKTHKEAALENHD